MTRPTKNHAANSLAANLNATARAWFSAAALSSFSPALRATAFAVSVGMVAAACHASPDDAAGQAKELSDSVRRENAVANLARLYGQALAESSGDRTAAKPKAIADASAEKLTQTYLQIADDPAQTSTGQRIMELLVEMRDVRSIPAVVKAFDWKPQQTEEHAIRAAGLLQNINLEPAQKTEAVQAIVGGFNRVNGSRPIDNRLRIEFIRALGILKDRSATATLSEVMLKPNEGNQFALNILAAEQMVKIADPAAVPALIKALFFFGTNAPQLRLNDVASLALTRIGRPALEPLLQTLAGRNADANRIAGELAQAGISIGIAQAEDVSAEAFVASEAATALGQLGMREAIEPLAAETRLEANTAPNRLRIQAASIALISIVRGPSDDAVVRDSIIAAFAKLQLRDRVPLLVGLRHLIDPGTLPFLLTQAGRPARAEDEVPQVREWAYEAYALIANDEEIAPLRALLTREPAGSDARTAFEDREPMLRVADQCKSDLSCWISKLSERDSKVARKAAYMVARLGRGQDVAINALADKLNATDADVRADIAYALDFAAQRGSASAIAKIDELRTREEGTSLWNRTRSFLLAIQARLIARSQ